jgi:signal transduction histidine kinase
VEALRLGAYDYILKPFEHFDLVMRTIRRALEKQSLARQVGRQHAELEAAYGKLRSLEQMKVDLVDMIAHDLRLPLFSLMGCLEHLQLYTRLEGAGARMLALAQQAGGQMTGLITEMLDISKLEESKMPLVRKPTALAPLIRASLAQLDDLATKSGVTLEAELPPDLPPVPLDETLIRRVLLNLLSNSLKFTPEGGRITVRAAVTPDTDELVVEVEDTGIGFESEYQLKIFDKFEQADSRQRGQWLGIGLGLTFCKLAVETHGGRIEARSSLGEGATFRFTLPLKPAAQPTP